MRKLLLTLSAIFLLLVSGISQKRSITGTVSDEQGAPVPFATITESGSKNATISDGNGNFILKSSSNDQLIFTAAGFSAVKATPTGNTVSVTLKRNTSELTTVVITTALGIQKQKKDLGYATARISSAQVNESAPVNIANGLQGKVSGLNITSINNGVFENLKINLRGIRSLTGDNNPLLLLDGVPLNISYLPSLNPNDIADVSVLKGSSAAAIYGPDAVNGVIVVTTKKGSRGGIPTITLSHTTQFSNISFFPKFQHEFGSGGYGEFTPYENWSWGPAYDGSTVPVGHQLPNGDQEMLVYSDLPNERKDFFNTGITDQNDVSYATKDFLISFQDVNIKGIVPSDKNRRTGIRMNTSREYGKFKVGFNVNYVQQNYNVFDDNAMSDYQRSQNVGLNGGLLNLIFNTPSYVPTTKYKDFKNDEFAEYNGYFTDYGLNPYFAIDNWRQVGKNEDLISNVDLNLKATNWLTLNYKAAAIVTSQSTTRSSKGETPTAFGVGRGFTSIPGAVTENFSRGSRLSSEFFANVNKTFGDFKLNVIAGNYYRQVDNRNTSVGAGNLVVPELFNVGNRTGELSGSSFKSRYRLISAYGSVGINYKGWANLEVTGRNDWTSLLAIGNNSFFYPGASVSFVLSDAIEGLKNSQVVSFLKVRGSWNKTANANIGPYSLAATFAQASGFPYGSLPGYTASNTAYDPQIQFEVVEGKEVGLELGFLKNRINIEGTYFQQNNSDQIIPINVSTATGFTNSYVNAAAFVNEGVELDLKLTPLFKLGAVSIDFRANATYNTSKVSSVYKGLDQLFIGGFDNFAANYAVVGKPAFVFKATDYIRDSLTGKVIVDAVTGYPTVDPNNKVFGRTLPLWSIGLNPSVTWKGLTVAIVGEYKGGHYSYNDIGQAMAWTGVSAATARNHRERFVFPNSVYEATPGQKDYINNTDVTISNVNDFYTGVYRDVASNFITSAASWRIREVSIGYRFPESILRNQKVIKGLSVTLNARNLFLWLPKSNEYTDPDFNFTATNSAGVSTSQINPPTRIIGANVTVTF
ncbi:MAG: SusC/RagA family TonB-linked outer membrane protein [Ginsengibacter sp.]